MKTLYSERIEVGYNDRDFEVSIFKCDVRFIVSWDEEQNFYVMEMMRERDAIMKGFCLFAKLTEKDFQRLAILNHFPAKTFEDFGAFIVDFANQLEKNGGSFIQCNGTEDLAIVQFHCRDWNLNMEFQRLSNLDVVGYLTAIIHEQCKDNSFLRIENETLKNHMELLEKELRSKTTTRTDTARDEKATKKIEGKNNIFGDAVQTLKDQAKEDVNQQLKQAIVADTLSTEVMSDKSFHRDESIDDDKTISETEESLPEANLACDIKLVDDEKARVLEEKIRKLQRELDEKKRCISKTEDETKQDWNEIEVEEPEKIESPSRRDSLAQASVHDIDRDQDIRDARGFRAQDFDDERKGPRGFSNNQGFAASNEDRRGGGRPFGGGERRGQGFGSEDRRGRSFGGERRGGFGDRRVMRDGRSRDECWNCGKHDHPTRECPQRDRPNERDRYRRRDADIESQNDRNYKTNVRRYERDGSRNNFNRDEQPNFGRSRNLATKDGKNDNNEW